MGVVATEPQGEDFIDWPLLLHRAARNMERVERNADFTHLGSRELFIRVGLFFGRKGPVSFLFLFFLLVIYGGQWPHGAINSPHNRELINKLVASEPIQIFAAYQNRKSCKI
jgi:hypothetical protein